MALQGGRKFLLLEGLWWVLGDDTLLFQDASFPWWVPALSLEGLLFVDQGPAGLEQRLISLLATLKGDARLTDTSLSACPTNLQREAGHRKGKAFNQSSSRGVSVF